MELQNYFSSHESPWESSFDLCVLCWWSYRFSQSFWTTFNKTISLFCDHKSVIDFNHKLLVHESDPSCCMWGFLTAIVNMLISRLQTPVGDVTLSMPILYIVLANNWYPSSCTLIHFNHFFVHQTVNMLFNAVNLGFLPKGCLWGLTHFQIWSQVVHRVEKLHNALCFTASTALSE